MGACCYELLHNPKCIKLIRWLPPLVEFKLNTDGAVYNRQARAEGLIRGKHGNGLMVFHQKNRRVSAITAERRAIRDGPHLAATINVKEIQVETDAQAVTDAQAGISLIMGDIRYAHHLSNLVHDCRCSMEELQVTTIDHVYQEGNSCADALAGLKCSDCGDVITIFHHQLC